MQPRASAYRRSLIQRIGKSLLPCALALAMMPMLTGCAGPVFGLVANAVVPEYKKVNVKADYRGLDDKTIAVMVSLNEYTYGQYPGAQSDLAWAISSELRSHVPDARLINPDEMIAFKEANPYWSTQRYSRLLDQLNVDRVVLVDILQYSMHEPGNRHIMQGVIVGDVKVIEATNTASVDPGSGDNLAYSKSVEVRYPEDDPIGLVNADPRQVEVATLHAFATNASRLFFDHQQLRPNR